MLKINMASELLRKIAQCFIVAAPLTNDEKEFWSVLRDYINLGVGGIMLGIGGCFPFVETHGQTDIEKLKQLTERVKSYDPSTPETTPSCAPVHGPTRAGLRAIVA